MKLYIKAAEQDAKVNSILYHNFIELYNMIKDNILNDISDIRQCSMTACSYFTKDSSNDYYRDMPDYLALGNMNFTISSNSNLHADAKSSVFFHEDFGIDYLKASSSRRMDFFIYDVMENKEGELEFYISNVPLNGPDDNTIQAMIQYTDPNNLYSEFLDFLRDYLNSAPDRPARSAKQEKHGREIDAESLNVTKKLESYLVSHLKKFPGYHWEVDWDSYSNNCTLMLLLYSDDDDRLVELESFTMDEYDDDYDEMYDNPNPIAYEHRAEIVKDSTDYLDDVGLTVDDLAEGEIRY